MTLRAVRDKRARYQRYELKDGDTFVGTLHETFIGRWFWYFDQATDFWPQRDWHSKQAALSAARKAWKFPRKRHDVPRFRERIEQRALLLKMTEDAKKPWTGRERGEES